MLFTLKALLRTIILPPGGLLLLAIAGLLLLSRRRRAGVALILAGVCGLWLLATPIVADELTLATERFPPLDLTKPVHAEAIVILGGGGFRWRAPEYGNAPVAELVLLERLSYGAYVARKTSLPILVTGAPKEAVAMRETLVRDFGVNVRWVENQSRDTFDNASYTARMLFADHIKRIVLVTSDNHLWRATEEFRSAGFEVVPAPAEVWAPREELPYRFVPTPRALERSQEALYELLGDRVRVILAAFHIRRH